MVRLDLVRLTVSWVMLAFMKKRESFLELSETSSVVFFIAKKNNKWLLLYESQ
jgi:hypothetical protein